jgi:hypothetical protein
MNDCDVFDGSIKLATDKCSLVGKGEEKVPKPKKTMIVKNERFLDV